MKPQIYPRQGGVSLIELIMFIVIVSIALVGILSIMNVTTRSSADPLMRKQAMAIAESLLEEIELQAFTYCFPTDSNADSANSSADCTGGVAGSEDVLPAAARVSNQLGVVRNANNVSDYHRLSLPVIYDMSGANLGLSKYSASVFMTQVGALFALSSNADALKIDVSVTDPAGGQTVLTGYRFRYAPRALP